MKRRFALCLAAGLAALPTALSAQEPAPSSTPHHPGKEGHGPRGPQDSLQAKAFQEGLRLRRDLAEKRRAYFEAVADKKDEAAKKAELLAAMDKWNAFEKAELEKAATRMAKAPKDTGRELHRDVARTRKAYFKAVADKKDEAAAKQAYFASLDKLVAYEKAHVDEEAARFAKEPKDGRRNGPHMRHPGGMHEGFGPGRGMECPRQGMQGPMSQGQGMMPKEGPQAEAPQQQAPEEMGMGPDEDMGPLAADFGGSDDDEPDNAFPGPMD